MYFQVAVSAIEPINLFSQVLKSGVEVRSYYPPVREFDTVRTNLSRDARCSEPVLYPIALTFNLFRRS